MSDFDIYAIFILIFISIFSMTNARACCRGLCRPQKNWGWGGVNILRVLGLPLFLVAALEIYLAAVLIKQNRRNSRVHKSVAAFSLFSAAFALNTAVMYTRASMGLDYEIFVRLNWIGWFSIPACLQFLYYLRDENSRIARNIGYILYPFWFLMFVLCVFTDLVEVGGYQLLPYVNYTGPLENPARFVGGVLILWVIVEIFRLRGVLTGIRKAQLNYFFHGTLIFAGTAALAAGFLQLAGGFGLEPGLGSYLSFPWVVLTFYAITRYRLFDIRIVVSRTLSIAVLFAIFAGLQLMLVWVLEPLFGRTSAMAISLGLIVLLFYGTPVSARVQEWVKGIVIQGKLNYQHILKEAAKAVITILDLDELLAFIIESIRKSLMARNVCLFLKNDDGKYRIRGGCGVAEGFTKGFALDDDLVRWIEQSTGAVVREEAERMLPEKEFSGLNEYMISIGAELVLPLRYKGEMRGIITVGQKGSGEPFDHSDIDLLEALAGHAAIAIENARLFEAARKAQESLKESEARLHNLMDSTVKKYLSL